MVRLLISLLLLPTLAMAGTYYVDINASDDNGTGAIGDPWETIEFAVTTSAAAHGDTIYVRTGDYIAQGEITPSKTDAVDSLIVMNYPGETVYSPNWMFSADNDDKDEGYYLYGLTIRNVSNDHGIELRGVNRITIDSCNINNCDKAGILLRHDLSEPPDTIVTNIIINNCIITANSQAVSDVGGIIIWADSVRNIHITNNDITLDPTGKGISWAAGEYQGAQVFIDSNNIINNFQSGIDIRDIDSSYVRWNWISYNGALDDEQLTSDPDTWEGGDKGLQMWDGASEIFIYGNVIKSSGGFQMVPTAGPFYVWNNTFYSDYHYNASPGSTNYKSCITLHEANATQSEFYNNIFVNVLTDSARNYIWTAVDGNDFDNQLMDYNQYWGVDNGEPEPYNLHWWMGSNSPWGDPRGTLDSVKAAGHEANSNWGDPLFTSVGDSDLTLASGSPAIDGGKALPDCSWIGSFNGTAWDMGAYESEAAASPSTGQTIIIF